MKKSWLLAGLLLLIVLIGFGVFIAFPGVTNAPTTQGPSVASTAPTATTTPASPAGPSVLANIIEVDQPFPNTKVASPLTIAGKARGSWYFEATAPVELKDASGVVVAHGTIRATGDWTSPDYVPFTGTLTFTAPSTLTGTLVLQNDNPSGDPKNQKELDIPVEF